MKQFNIYPKDNPTKAISIFADKLQEGTLGELIFKLNDEIIAIFFKKDFIVEE